MNWSAWLYGLLSAILSSVGGAGAVIIVDPATFNINAGLVPLLKVMAVMAIVAFLNYIKTTPPPKPPSVK